MNRTAVPRAAAGLVALALLIQPVAASGVEDTLLSHNRSTSTSSIEDAGFTGGHAVDGVTTTRWASAEGADPQWIAVSPCTRRGGQPVSGKRGRSSQHAAGQRDGHRAGGRR